MKKDEMWKIFLCTGNIDAYLYYKESNKNDKIKIHYENSKREEKLLQGF